MLRDNDLNYYIIAGGRFVSGLVNPQTPQFDFTFSNEVFCPFNADRIEEILRLLRMRYPAMQFYMAPILVETQLVRYSRECTTHALQSAGVNVVTVDDLFTLGRVDGPIDPTHPSAVEVIEGAIKQSESKG